MIIINEKGGLTPLTPNELKRAKSVDLITLPREITGTNCFNCKFISQKTANVGFCRHPKIKQDVNARMCCALWFRDGSIRAWE